MKGNPSLKFKTADRADANRSGCTWSFHQCSFDAVTVTY